ncbi:MAG: hypothetical protein K9L25_13965 [Methylovulum sp.]|jgi:hypothetical protein|nr:hypothetical protein [Methylovulum sp.]MCF8008021.1 hypothetical protein [Methylovulum sp.]
MSKTIITESGMHFPYEEGQCFHIEKSAVYSKMQGVKIAEFLLVKYSKVLVIEAKSSSPSPHNKINFDDFIQEIHEKLLNAFSLSVAIFLNRHSLENDTLPNEFQNLELSHTDFLLLLIINGHKTEWLEPIQYELKKSLHSTVKTWALSPNSVVVMNDEIAREKGLIQ